LRKSQKHYVCSNCGYESDKWFAKCPMCNELESAVEYNTADVSIDTGHLKVPDIVFLDQELPPAKKIPTNFQEIDNVLNGGLVEGAVYLLSGDPGIGKSTLLAQIAKSIQTPEGFIFYVSGEESTEQVVQRFNRLEIKNKNIGLIFENNVDVILNAMEKSNMIPSVIFIDSVQTLKIDSIDSSPGSILQVRESTRKMVEYAKKMNIPIVLVGHVNKEGAIAGPKVLEHMVDCVLQMELEGGSGLRLLKVTKNRYGPTDEVILFEITQKGLKPIDNINSFFLSDYSNESGNTLTIVKVGQKLLPIEIQALVSNPVYGSPRRVTSGIPLDRLLMIIAVLSKKLKLPLESKDIFVSSAGGLRINDSSMDVAIALSLISSIFDTPLSSSTIAFGEIGLDGRIRGIPLLEKRLELSQKIGFNNIVIPKNFSPRKNSIVVAESVKDLIKLFKKGG
jgi:DNA repair protein RadA/Sms